MGIHPSKLTTHYKRICVAAGLPVTRLHDMRHTNASILVKQSFNMK